MPAVTTSEPRTFNHTGVEANTNATPPANSARSKASAARGRRVPAFSKASSSALRLTVVEGSACGGPSDCIELAS